MQLPADVQKIGLALGSGGAKGLAHIGVIKALVEKNIPIGVITGSSAGSLIGGMYAALGDIEEVEKIFSSLQLKTLLYYFADPGSFSGVLRGERVKSFLDKYLKGAQIEDLKIPFRAVATDIATGEGVVIDHGDLVTAIRASASAPGLFAPARIDNKLVVDGGISQMVPVQAARGAEADYVIAVNLYSSKIGLNLEPNKRFGVSAATVLKNSMYFLCNSLAKENVKYADLVITPDVGSVMWYDLSQISEIIDIGYSTALNILA